MPKYRDVYIEKEKTLADSGTVTVELAVVDPISEIHIRFKAKNGGTSNKNNPITRNISKIEIVDGSKVLYSLNGMLAQSMSYYQRRIMPCVYRQEGPTENQEDHFVIRFGRWLYDSVYALVPQRFRNLQLKITWDLATITTVGATGYLADSAKLTVITRLMEGLDTEPTHFMMAKDHYSWTTAASGDERIPLPTDHPYVMMLFRAWEINVKLETTITNLKLSIDQDKDIPFDLDSWEFLQWMKSEYGLFTLESHIFGTQADVVQTWVGSGESGVLTAERDPGAGSVVRAGVNFDGVDSGHINLYSEDHNADTASEGICHLIMRGQALNHCFARQFGIMSDPATYLQAQDFGDIKAIITQGNAGAAANLALMQAKSY